MEVAHVACPKSVYKDDRHDWHGEGPKWPTARDLKFRICYTCERVEILQLTDSGSQAGDIWEVIASGQRGVVL